MGFVSRQSSTKPWLNWDFGRQRQREPLSHRKIVGVYHFQKFGNFPSGSSIREERVSFEWSLFRSQASLYCSNLPRKFKMAVQMLMLHENLEFSIDEESLINSGDDGERNILSAVATFLSRNLNRNQGYYECSLPAYSMRFISLNLTPETLALTELRVSRKFYLPFKHVLQSW